MPIIHRIILCCLLFRVGEGVNLKIVKCWKEADCDHLEGFCLRHVFQKDKFNTAKNGTLIKN